MPAHAVNSWYAWLAIPVSHLRFDPRILACNAGDVSITSIRLGQTVFAVTQVGMGAPTSIQPEAATVATAYREPSRWLRSQQTSAGTPPQPSACSTAQSTIPETTPATTAVDSFLQ